MKVLVVGDRIVDKYVFGYTERICVEAPIPIIIPESQEDRPGGASLVASQLSELIGSENVIERYGSNSFKHRLFANGHLVSRWDEDHVWVRPKTLKGWKTWDYELREEIKQSDAIIVSDYGKGGMDPESATVVVNSGKPVFVDAKNSWDWYYGSFCAFPNRTEELKGPVRDSRDGLVLSTKNWPFEHIVRKVGPKGCLVDDKPIPPSTVEQVRDCTGAGDIFLAAFVSDFMEYKNLIHAAQFANLVAGISVRHVGTYVVKKSEIPLDKHERIFAEAT